MKHTHMLRKMNISVRLTALAILICLALAFPIRVVTAEQQAVVVPVPSGSGVSDNTTVLDTEPSKIDAPVSTDPLSSAEKNLLPEADALVNPDNSTEIKKETDPEPEKPKEDTVDPENKALSSDQNATGANSAQAKSNQPSVDPTSGALSYSYPFVTPQGRSGFQPDLKLSYSSQSSDENSAFGVGWSLSLPVISRVNKTGSNQLYSQNNFTSSLSGELVDLGGGNFGSKVDNGEFLSYNFANNSWVVKDKKGTTYKFGASLQTRQADPAENSRVYQWMIEEARDTNDNYLRYEYFKDAGQLYPSRIVYTGSGNVDGIFSVDFFREARGDVTENFRAGFKVETNFRISQIETSVSGSWVRRYNFTYGLADDNASSKITSILESGRDEASGAVVTLPAQTFSYQASTGQFTEATTNLQLPDIYFNRYYNGADKGGRLVDVNGDSLQDLLIAYNDGATNDKRIFLNTGSGWSETSSWTIPDDVWLSQSNERDTGWRIADINGDNLSDLIISYDQGGGLFDKRVYLNNGVNGWTPQNGTWQIPDIFFAQANATDPGGRMADANGDGLPDLFKAHYIPTNPTGPITDWQMYLNTGSGWAQSLAWIFPEDFHISNYYNSKDQGTRLADINSDGLLDAATNFEESPAVFKKRVYINTGSGWVLDSKWTLPDDAVFTNYNGRDFGWRIIDANGDGRTDLVKLLLKSGIVEKQVYLNNGSSDFIDVTSSFQFPDAHFSTYQYGWDTGLRDSDVTGDGLTDLVWSQHENAGGHIQKVFTHNGLKPNLLNQILYSTGASTTVQYQNSSLYRDSGSQSLNPQLPTNLFTVKQLSHNSGFGNVSTINYSYEQGKYFYGSPQNRKFAGFGKITKTNSAGTEEASYFHQGDSSNSAQGEYADHESKIGKIYRTEIRNSSGQLYKASIQRWDRRDLGNSRDFIYQTQTVQQVWDGLSTHADSAESFDYEDFGNITIHTQYGEVTGNSDGSFADIGSDKRVTSMTYAHNGSNYLHSHLENQTLYDQTASVVSQKRLYYDNSASLGVITKGNLTKQEAWVSGPNYVSNLISYNQFGLPVLTTDGSGNQTTIGYDINNLYPASVTNSLGHVASAQYDYSSGQKNRTTDGNGFVRTVTFDGFDRPLQENQPDATNPNLLVLAKSYSYGDTPLQNFVATTEYLSDTISKSSYSYVDGFRRPIQTRVQAGSSQYSVSDTEYNSEGSIARSSLPYYASGSGRSGATSDNSLYTNLQYDVLARPILSTTALGSVTTSFEGLKTSVTNELGKIKRYYRDAFGQLVTVEEINSGQVYPTSYQYNSLGKLVKVTDALGNVRHFSYDGLGNRLSAQDLHASSDTTFGTWLYAYDTNNNLTQVTDAKGQVINYSYDKLNRLTVEDFTANAGVEQAYSYDTCTNGKGKLCQSANASVTASNLYTPLGEVSREIKIIGGSTFQTDYSYFRGGQLQSFTQPDLSIVGYIYGAGAVLERVNKTEAGTGLWSDVILAVTYSPTGEIVTISYADGSQTINTYDSQKQYRLTHKLTMSGSSRIQDIAYTYDAVGNMTRLVDSSQTKTAKTVDYTYDDLNRLLSSQASAVASGQQTYTHAYTYNAIGNMLTRMETIGVTPTITYTYSYGGDQGVSVANPHALTSISNGTVTNNFSYDANGNVVGDDVQTYTWDYNNRLASAVAAGSGGGVPTVATFYATTGDGSIYKTATSWDPSHDAVSGTSAVYTGTTLTAGSGKSGSTTYRLDRAFFGFDTSSLPDNATVTDSVLKVFVNSKLNNDNDGDDWMTVVQGSQPSTSSLTTADYDLAGSINTPTEGVDAGERKDISTVATGQYLNINLNSAGKSWVSKTGSTKLALREGHDVVDSPVVLGSGQYNQLTLRTANYTGTTSDPMLSVTYTTTPPPATITYAYDHTGQRVSSTTGAVTTKYPSGFYNWDGTTIQKHILLGDLSIATVKGSGAGASIFYNHADHLSGGSVLTNSSGGQEEVLDYFPYGTIRVDDKVGSFDEQRKYIGQEYDTATGLSYLNARYYNSATAKFLSQDLLFWELPKEYLEDPQQQNSYAYARNNPIVGSDPTGLLTIVVPGTWHNREGWVNSDFVKNVKNTFNDKNFVVFTKDNGWNGGDNSNERTVSAINLAYFVKQHRSDGEQLNIVAHSHGGNIVIEALSHGAFKGNIDNLITIGTPVRSDYKLDTSRVGNHINAFSWLDPIQFFGGGQINMGKVGLLLGSIPAYASSKDEGEFGLANKRYHNEKTINVNLTLSSFSPIIPRIHTKLYSNLQNWNKIKSKIGF